MSSGFSSGLRITGIDDFMGPSQECVKPVKIEKRSEGVVRIQVEEDGTYSEINLDGSKSKLAPTKITLNDCLACSGCVTTAETVLIEAQGTAEFYRHLNTQETVVITISAQSRASLAAHFDLSLEETEGKLISMFNSLGCKHVFDAAFSRDLSLLESAREFVERKKSSSPYALPMLASSCPGWICYAEKTHGDFVLPYISTTKSPQQIMGSLVKSYFAQSVNITPSSIYHVAIMPCYDKKLEASRDDFYNDLLRTRDVDCVLATTEIIQMLSDKSIDFKSLPTAPLTPSPLRNVDPSGRLFGNSGGTSGGFLEFIFQYAAKELFGQEETRIENVTGKNSDFSEVNLIVGGQPRLRFARANGFRNIQNIVRALKRSKKDYYDFIEVMACPGGCTNGGGQIRAENTTEAKTLLAKVDSIFNTSIARSPFENPAALELYSKLASDEKALQQYLHTSYHAVAKLEVTNPRSIKW